MAKITISFSPIGTEFLGNPKSGKENTRDFVQIRRDGKFRRSDVKIFLPMSGPTSTIFFVTSELSSNPMNHMELILLDLCDIGAKEW